MANSSVGSVTIEPPLDAREKALLKALFTFAAGAEAEHTYTAPRDELLRALACDDEGLIGAFEGLVRAKVRVEAGSDWAYFPLILSADWRPDAHECKFAYTEPLLQFLGRASAGPT